MITGNSDVPIAVQAMKAGASDFIEKPVGRGELLACVERALEQSQDPSKLLAWRESAADHVSRLTPRQRQIMNWCSLATEQEHRSRISASANERSKTIVIRDHEENRLEVAPGVGPLGAGR